MNVEDYSRSASKAIQRLHEKGGKYNEVPAHHIVQEYVQEYIDIAGIADFPTLPLFRAIRIKNGRRELSKNRLNRKRAYDMIKRRLKKSGLSPVYSPHSMRATGITNYLLNGGSIEVAQDIAGHADARTTRLYDRRADQVNQGEIELIRF